MNNIFAVIAAITAIAGAAFLAFPGLFIKKNKVARTSLGWLFVILFLASLIISSMMR